MCSKSPTSRKDREQIILLSRRFFCGQLPKTDDSLRTRENRPISPLERVAVDLFPEREQISRRLKLWISIPNPLSTAPAMSRAPTSGLPATRVSSWAMEGARPFVFP